MSNSHRSKKNLAVAALLGALATASVLSACGGGDEDGVATSVERTEALPGPIDLDSLALRLDQLPVGWQEESLGGDNQSTDSDVLQDTGRYFYAGGSPASSTWFAIHIIRAYATPSKASEDQVLEPVDPDSAGSDMYNVESMTAPDSLGDESRATTGVRSDGTQICDIAWRNARIVEEITFGGPAGMVQPDACVKLALVADSAVAAIVPREQEEETEPTASEEAEPESASAGRGEAKRANREGVRSGPLPVSKSAANARLQEGCQYSTPSTDEPGTLTPSELFGGTPMAAVPEDLVDVPGERERASVACALDLPIDKISVIGGCNVEQSTPPPSYFGATSLVADSVVVVVDWGMVNTGPGATIGSIEAFDQASLSGNESIALGGCVIPATKDWLDGLAFGYSVDGGEVANTFPTGEDAQASYTVDVWAAGE